MYIVSDYAVWKKEKEAMKIKVTQRLKYPEARKIYDQQKTELTFYKVVSSIDVEETQNENRCTYAEGPATYKSNWPKSFFPGCKTEICTFTL